MNDLVPRVFQSEDTVYHYCDLKTAVEHILYGKRLRLSHRNKSFDPIENIKPWFSFAADGSRQDGEIFIPEDAKAIQQRSADKIHNAKQLCLCMNDAKKVSINSNPKYPHEYYGFLKPGMWDRYGDRYKGVCLAFSLEALKKNGQSFVNGSVEYLEYHTLELNHFSIDENVIKNIGVNEYWHRYSQKIEKILLRKHRDYIGENEYRFLSFSESEYDYIDIADCLKGIIVSHTYTSDFMKNALNKYAEEYNVELLNIRWQRTGISFTTKKEDDHILQLIENHLKDQNQSLS